MGLGAMKYLSSLYLPHMHDPCHGFKDLFVVVLRIEMMFLIEDLFCSIKKRTSTVTLNGE
jgi:hypothetical protein